ncbi:MAG TPA: hypothetical protein VFY31_04945 [Macromonas sp.]|nr:hypothetical protein [Macromonas sp.]
MTPPYRRLLLWSAMAVVLALVFTLYLRPDFVLDVANQIWGCY